MNFTGGVILGLLYFLPGILFVFGLSKLFDAKLPSPFEGQLSTGIVLALLAALFIHTIAIIVLCLVPLGPDPDVSKAMLLLLGDYKSEEIQSALGSLGDDWLYISVYFLSISAAAFWFGSLANKYVRLSRRADWYDLLTRDADILWLTADVQVGGIAYLFAGVLKDFKISSDGELDRVVLVGAVRRTLKRPTQEQMDSKDEDYKDGGWIPIPGEYVVLNMSGCNTVNVDYWYLEENNVADDVAESNLGLVAQD